jgi:hypothetical protein
MPSGQKLTLGLLAAITLQVVLFRAYAPLPALLPFLHASRKSCYVPVFSPACESASITSIVSKWRPFRSIFNREAEKSRLDCGRQSCCFSLQIPWWKGKCESVRCRDATASSFVAKVRGEAFAHFHAVAVKRHNSVRNLLFVLRGQILCEQSPSC